MRSYICISFRGKLQLFCSPLLLSLDPAEGSLITDGSCRQLNAYVLRSGYYGWAACHFPHNKCGFWPCFCTRREQESAVGWACFLKSLVIYQTFEAAADSALYSYHFILSTRPSVQTVVSHSAPHPPPQALWFPMTVSDCLWIFAFRSNQGQSAKETINRGIVAVRMVGLSRKLLLLLLLLQGTDQWHWQRPSHSFRDGMGGSAGRAWSREKRAGRNIKAGKRDLLKIHDKNPLKKKKKNVRFKSEN